MSQRKVTLAINNIRKSIVFLRSKDNRIFYKTLKTLGVYKLVWERSYSYGIYRLSDVESSLNNLDKIYENNGDRLTSLSRNIREICKKYPGGNQLNSSVLKTDITSNNVSKSNKNSSHDKSIDRIQKRTSNCCLCLTLLELSKISEQDFIKLLKVNFNSVTGHKLEGSRTKSWRDEYRQFKNVIIPIFRRYDKEILNFHIVFELKLPLELTNLESGKYVFADAVIVGSDGVVVFEFKQLDSSTIKYDAKQALKYMHRLRYHKISAHQHERYTYIIYTKETDAQVYCYDDKKDFWYGNPKGVAKDLCTQYFDNDTPNEDIEEWLSAGFWKKRSKK